jgi:DNA-binding SARP family transcriptional activator/tetratricopeptide (TPR) repeat protein
VRFRLLGTLDVFDDAGAPVRLTGLRQRKLLALLLLNAERAVSLDALVEAVWDDDPPATAKRQVQNSISALRRLLTGCCSDRPGGPPVIVAEGNAYRLRLAGAELDARIFSDQVAAAQELASAGRIGEAAANLRAATKLWRGPPLAGMTGRVLEAAAARLDEQRHSATEETVELELRLGRHGELVGELTELVAVYPLRERLVGQLMRALDRSGRRADALEVYRRFRLLLADELGLDPGVPLQELHTAILNDEPDPAWPGAPADQRAGPRVGQPAAARPPAPAQLPTDVAGFTGRADHLKELDELLAVDPAGPATAVVISAIAGTAGVGKTALAVHWGQKVRHHFPDGQLYANLRGFDPAGAAVDPADALRGFLDALGVSPDGIPVDLTGRATLFRSTVAGRRLLVLLDNALDADQVRPLLPGSPTCVVLITSRNQQSGLVAAEGARPVILDLFDQAEAHQLLAVRLGAQRLAAEPEAVDEIVTQCARLPLALAVAAARAAARPGFPLAALAADLRAARGGLDAFAGTDPATDVRAVFSWSYRQLNEAAKRLFRLLALVPGPDLTAPAASSLAGLPLPQTHWILAELAGAHLVIEYVPGRYTLHDLLRTYAGELAYACDRDEDRNDALHRLLDHYLHTARAADRWLDRYRDPVSLAAARPGVTLCDVDDHEQAMTWFTVELAGLLAAVDRAAGAGFDPHAWQLAWALAYFLERRGHWLPWLATQQTALAASLRLADRTGQAHAHRSLGRAHVHLGRLAEAVAHLRQAEQLFQAVGDASGQARVHFDMCWIAEREGRPRPMLEHAQRALDLFRRTDNRSGLARALNNVAWGHSAVGDYRQALDAGEQALDLVRQLDDRFGAADTWDTLGEAHSKLGNHRKAISCYLHAVELYRDLGHRWREADALTRLGEAHWAAGAPGAARATWRRAVAILEELAHPDAQRVRAKLGED